MATAQFFTREQAETFCQIEAVKFFKAIGKADCAVAVEEGEKHGQWVVVTVPPTEFCYVIEQTANGFTATSL